MLIGYARVSTADQNLDLQRDALKKAGCRRVFTDQMSGTRADRPGLTDALSHAREGDVLVVWRLDRLGRNLSVVAGPRVLGAQESKMTVPLVGALWLGQPSAPITLRVTEAFRQGLRENGYLEGRNIAIEYRYGVSADAMRNAANEFVRLNVDVIMASSTPAALAAKRATNTIPIVGASMADPLADGLVASLARPVGNVTGNTFLGPELNPKRLQLLREVVPSATRFAALQHPGVYSERTMRNMLTEMEQSAKTSGVELQVFSAIGPNEFDDTFEGMVKARAGALISTGHTFLISIVLQPSTWPRFSKAPSPVIFPWSSPPSSNSL